MKVFGTFTRFGMLRFRALVSSKIITPSASLRQFGFFSVASTLPMLSEKSEELSTTFNFQINGDSSREATFYQYAVCPFCNKAKTFLSIYQIPFKELGFVEVNPFTKREIKFSDYRKVPLMVLESTDEDGKQVSSQINGSDQIIDYFLQQQGIVESQHSKHWRAWVNDSLTPLLPMNLYRTVPQAVSAFEYITDASKFNAFEKFYTKYLGAVFMNFIAKRAMKKRGVKDPEARLVECLEQWTNEGLLPNQATQAPGDKVAEAAVFGVISVLDGNYQVWETLQHEDFHNSERFWQWYKEMKEKC